jgi:hypothetical protein
MSKSSNTSQHQGHSTSTAQFDQASESGRVLNSGQQHCQSDHSGSEQFVELMSGSTSSQQLGAAKPLFRDWASI